MRIATWNVNSIRARQERLSAWLAQHEPDVLCIQETKCEDGTFPLEECRTAGYALEIHGQRSYNGVAILAREPLAEVTRGFGDGGDESQARLISARVGEVHVLNVYVPNGQDVQSPKFPYKLEWLNRLRDHIAARFKPTDKLVVCGDFNVAPEPRDVHDPAAMEGRIHFTRQEREAIVALRSWGLIDTFRLHHESAGLFSWWDYRQLCFPKNIGLRIDLLLATESLAQICNACNIDRDARKGKGASDHAPVVATFQFG